MQVKIIKTGNGYILLKEHYSLDLGLVTQDFEEAVELLRELFGLNEEDQEEEPRVQLVFPNREAEVK